MWLHQKTNSKTFYIGEQVTTLSAEASIKEIVWKPSVTRGVFPQVSHHPPVSAFYVSNRKDGFCLSGSILAKSKFYGIDTYVSMSRLQRWRLLQVNDKTCPLAADYPPRKLPVRHIRWRGAPHVSQPRRGLCDEHALRSLQRSACPAPTHPGYSQATLTSPPYAFLSPQASCMAPWPWNWVVRLPSPVRKQATVLSWSSDWRYSFVLLFKSRLQRLWCIAFLHICYHSLSLFWDFWLTISRLRFFSENILLQTSLSSFFLFISHSTWAKPINYHQMNTKENMKLYSSLSLLQREW